MPNDSYKYQKLKNDLIRNIVSGAFPGGSRIEPELLLAKRHGLSRNTVRQAILELENEGFLYRIRGSGTYVCTSLPQRSVKVPFLLFNAEHTAYPLMSDVIVGIDSYLNEHGFLLDLMVTPRHTDSEYFNRLAERSAGILIGMCLSSDEGFPDVSHLPVPVRFVKNYLAEYMEKSIRFDYFNAGFLIAQHLGKRGIKKPALLCPAASCAIAQDFKRGVMSACAKYDMTLLPSFCMEVPYMDTVAANAAGLSLAESGNKPDAVICGADELAFEVMKHFHGPVTGCNDIPLSRFYNLTTIRLSGKKLGILAAKALLEDIHGNVNVYPCVEPELIVRG